jgi:hypothetical protein
MLPPAPKIGLRRRSRPPSYPKLNLRNSTVSPGFAVAASEGGAAFRVEQSKLEMGILIVAPEQKLVVTVVGQSLNSNGWVFSCHSYKPRSKPNI